MNTDIMIDLETLATSPDAAVLTIGAVKFDPNGLDLKEPKMDSFYVKVDVDSCHQLGLVTSDDTLAWWAQQGPDAQAEAFGEEGRIPIQDAMNQLYKFCWGAKRVWSHGAGFDVVICETIFRRMNKAVPWNFWQVRDTRTLYDLGLEFDRPEVLKHHALHDAYSQAVGVQNIIRKLRSSTTYDGKMIMPFKEFK
jgi:DNA polymerase III epsilon subunit-like protein